MANFTDYKNSLQRNPIQGFPVLVFHLIRSNLINSNCISPDRLSDIINTIRDAGFCFSDITLSDIVDQTRKEKKVIFTFDDAYVSVLENAWPLLSAQKIPFTIFVPVKHVGRTNLWNPKASYIEKHLSWNDLRYLVKNNIQVGSHGVTHQSLVKFGSSQIQRELMVSKTTLEENLECAIEYVAYPYGDVNPKVEEISKSVYKAGFSVWQGGWYWNEKPWAINRIHIQSTDLPVDILNKIRLYYPDY